MIDRFALVFLTSLLLPALAFADVSDGESFFSRHVRPGLERAIDSRSLSLIASGAAAVATAHQFDPQVRDTWRDHQRLSRETTRWGENYGHYVVGTAIALGQTYFDRDNGLSHLRAIVGALVVTQSLKYSVRRDRPNQSESVSFPSGHTSDAFASATSLTYAYGWRAGLVAYPIATFVALSRLADDMHWFSDVTAGALIGIWMGRAFFYSSTSDGEPAATAWQWQLLPQISSHSSGVAFTVEF